MVPNRLLELYTVVLQRLLILYVKPNTIQAIHVGSFRGTRTPPQKGWYENCAWLQSGAWFAAVYCGSNGKRPILCQQRTELLCSVKLRQMLNFKESDLNFRRYEISSVFQEASRDATREASRNASRDSSREAS